jgi:hypothetical protein
MSPSLPRYCYCDLWEKNPDALIARGIPEGFCGFCQVCGAPGHLRHHPAAIPVTGAWCDRHYRYIALTHPLAPVGCLLWLGVGASAIGLLLWIFAH